MSPILAAVLALPIYAAAPPPLDPVPQTRLDPDLRCLLGPYALTNERVITITGDAGLQRGLQYTLSDGEFGALRETADGRYAAPGKPDFSLRFEPCEAQALQVSDSGVSARAKRVPLKTLETDFKNGDVTLHGKLVMPPSGQADAIAVWIGGSNNNPETDDLVWPYELARRGVGVFVYDKRGAGASTGSLSADFHVRASDTVAAVAEARRLSPKVRRFGVIGASQGGWVAPLTARSTSLDFVVVAYGAAESVTAQDREIVEGQLRRAGYDEAVIATSRELTATTRRIVLSNFTEGFDELAALKARYGKAPWVAAIQPRSYTGLLLSMPSIDPKALGPSPAQGLSFDFEPRPVIETIASRQLWLLGGSDHQAPNVETQHILSDIQKSRRDLDMVVFPAAQHGLFEVTKVSDRPRYAYSKGLFDLVSRWILTSVPTAQGDMVVSRGAQAAR